MSLPAGEEVYTHGRPPCHGTGVVWTREELDEAIKGPVASILFDEEGKSGIRETLGETEFETAGIEDVLRDPNEVDGWRVGEAIADTYLTHYRSCTFPWPSDRDKRKSGSSLPGADLVGLGIDDNGDCLAFGEVKTSNEKRYPPKVMYDDAGGLSRQLTNLRDGDSIRKDLFKYLGVRAKHAEWKPRFQSAGKRFLKNNSDVQIYGVLVRDVKPNVRDIQKGVDELVDDCPEETRIEFLAVYIPCGEISNLGNKTVSQRSGSKR